MTFLVEDNGTGKSTLVEALAVAAGFNAEGGSQSFGGPGDPPVRPERDRSSSWRRTHRSCSRCRAPGSCRSDLDGTIEQVDYDAAEPVTLTRSFLADPARFLHHLFTDDH
ncbi:MAG: hypothetical protein ACRDQ4_06065 [Pseudonocardiaceae bacterium]